MIGDGEGKGDGSSWDNLAYLLIGITLVGLLVWSLLSLVVF